MGPMGLGTSPVRMMRLRVALDDRVGNGDGGEEGSGVGVLGVLVELVPAGYLDDLAKVHDRDPVRDVPHDGQVVGDEKVGEVEALLEGERSRLITCAWMDTSRAETGSSQTMKDGLTARARAMPILWRWAAAELVRITVHHVGIEAHDLEQFLHLALSLVAVAQSCG